MKKQLLILLLLFGAGFVKAQNLIPNYSFEQYDSCPDLTEDCFDFLLDWYNPTLATPDQFNICANNQQDNSHTIPRNPRGYQFPYKGVGYVGFLTGGFNGNDESREYISIKLLEGLELNTNYCLSAYVSLSDEYNISTTLPITPQTPTICAAIDKIGVCFSQNIIVQPTFNALPYQPQVYLKDPNSSFIDDTSNWQLIYGDFTPGTNNLEYITIGNFADNNSTIYKSVGTDTSILVSYYYIDNVFLFEPKPVQLKADTTKICASDTIALHALGLALEYEWYNQGNPNEIIGRDTVLNISPDSTTTYILKNRSCSTTEEKTITIEVCEKTPQGTFLLYPNPANGFATLNYNFGHYDGKPVIELFDAAGRIVFTQQLGTANKSIDIPVYGLATAIYEVRVIDGNSKLWHGKLAVSNN